MKQYIKLFLMSLCLTFSMTACTDYLDKAPESDISDTDAFKDWMNFQGFTEELYYCVPDFTNGYWTNSWNWGDDEIMNVGPNYHMCYKVDLGDFWGWQSEFDGWQSGWMDRNGFNPGGDRFAHSLWPGAWYGIRKANMGLANLDKFSGSKEEKDIIAGQLYFFRGWFHFELMQFFGGLPYIDTVLPAGEKLTLPRLSYAECAEKAAADFRKAADLLPVDWDKTSVGRKTPNKNQLRVTKIAALGYLGKNLLFAGSPLMNQVSTGSATYNKEFCQRAAQAFGELLSIVDGGDTQYGLLPFEEYSSNFMTIGANGRTPGQTDDLSITEAIFRGPTFGSGWGSSAWGQVKCYGGADISDGSVFFFPTANYVNYYGMANGLPLTDAESGFEASHPWEGRDPRFYHDIKYDGCQLVKGTLEPANEKWRFADLQTDGNLRNTTRGSRTGYLNYKFIDITCNRFDDGYGWSPQIHMHIPYMRLADIYLMYAEAAAEAQGTASAKINCGLTAVDAINKVRARAGVEPVAAKYTNSLEGFMSEVRRERAVELSFEGHRFNDLRRWLLLDKAPYNTKTSQEFKRVGSINEEDASKNQVIDFREENILTRNFTSKHYWLPLKKTDTSMYLEFTQNPGW
jgi:hypothetical protein